MTEQTIYMLAFVFRHGHHYVCNRYAYTQRGVAVAAMRRENARDPVWRWYLHKATVATL